MPIQDELIMYGDVGQVAPLDVARWHLSAAYNSVQAPRLPSEVIDNVSLTAPHTSVVLVLNHVFSL